MKISFTKTTLVSTLLLLTLSVKAQNWDYVINNNNDTLKGKFVGKKFQAIGWDKPKRLDLSDYRETYNANDNTLSRAVIFSKKGTRDFLPVLENGKISLYRKIVYKMGYMIPGTNGWWSNTASAELFVSKGNDSVTKLSYSEFGIVNLESKKNRMNVLGEMLKDNEDVYNKFIAENKFNPDQIRNLIHLYNTGRPFGTDIPRDYIIRNKKDTVFCEIEQSTINTLSLYRVNANSRFTKIDTSVSEDFIAKDASTHLLRTLPKNNRREYVKLLVKGRINLYAYSLDYSTKDYNASLYVDKDSGDLVQIKHAFSSPDKDEKKAFTNLISDDPDLVEKARNNSYDFTSILNFIKIYDSHYSNKGKSNE